MEKEGADIIDIGGESTGPGSENVTLEEELERTIPIIKEIRKHTQTPISIDTYKSEVADAAIQAGANIINDITALRGDLDEKGDSKMAKIAKKHKCPIILMYSKDQTARTTKTATEYTDIIQTITDFFTTQLQYAQEQGLKKENIISANSAISCIAISKFFSLFPRFVPNAMCALFSFIF